MLQEVYITGSLRGWGSLRGGEGGSLGGRVKGYYNIAASCDGKFHVPT